MSVNERNPSCATAANEVGALPGDAVLETVPKIKWNKRAADFQQGRVGAETHQADNRLFTDVGDS